MPLVCLDLSSWSTFKDFLEFLGQSKLRNLFQSHNMKWSSWLTWNSWLPAAVSFVKPCRRWTHVSRKWTEVNWSNDVCLDDCSLGFYRLLTWLWTEESNLTNVCCSQSIRSGNLLHSKTAKDERIPAGIGPRQIDQIMFGCLVSRGLQPNCRQKRKIHVFDAFKVAIYHNLTLHEVNTGKPLVLVICLYLSLAWVTYACYRYTNVSASGVHIPMTRPFI